MLRRNFLACLTSGAAIAQVELSRLKAQAPPSDSPVFLERPATGQPQKGKVLLALQAHSDDIPLMAAGTVAKLIEEGYTGYLIRATNDDMGDAPGLGTPGTIGENVLRNEQDNEEIARVLGCKRTFNLNYNNHRMADVSLNELICRLILIIRFVKADTVVCWDPWAHDEENPDHYMLARGLEAACWMAGRAHDYPEQLAAGLQPHEVADKYYFARRPEITRVVDISRQIEKKVDANRANTAKGPAGHLGSRLRTELAKRGERLPLLGNGDDVAADRNYIKEFVMRQSRELGKKYGVEYAEAFHYLPAGSAGAGTDPTVENYVKRYAVPKK
ncbi:MAG TPA: PIG-L family deacetylase [Bryobacteraceae bacterium]|jgi:LmbE family N-acetylglucosaminyl deacetylase